MRRFHQNRKIKKSRQVFCDQQKLKIKLALLTYLRGRNVAKGTRSRSMLNRRRNLQKCLRREMWVWLMLKRKRTERRRRIKKFLFALDISCWNSIVIIVKIYNLGGFIIWRIFASEIWVAHFRGGGGGIFEILRYFRNFTVFSDFTVFSY